ncbi:MAG: hypothetical protein AAF235_02270 [Planctomycetota bacterium]
MTDYGSMNGVSLGRPQGPAAGADRGGARSVGRLDEATPNRGGSDAVAREGYRGGGIRRGEDRVELSRLELSRLELSRLELSRLELSRLEQGVGGIAGRVGIEAAGAAARAEGGDVKGIREDLVARVRAELEAGTYETAERVDLTVDAVAGALRRS